MHTIPFSAVWSDTREENVSSRAVPFKAFIYCFLWMAALISVALWGSNELRVVTFWIHSLVGFALFCLIPFSAFKKGRTALGWMTIGCFVAWIIAVLCWFRMGYKPLLGDFEESGVIVLYHLIGIPAILFVVYAQSRMRGKYKGA